MNTTNDNIEIFILTNRFCKYYSKNGTKYCQIGKEIEKDFISDIKTIEEENTNANQVIPKVKCGYYNINIRRPTEYKIKFDINNPKLINPNVFVNKKNSKKFFNITLPKESHNNTPCDILFFIHGHNNSVKDTIKSLIRIINGIEFRGMVLCFSWSSKTRLLGKHGSDLDDIKLSYLAIRWTINNLLKQNWVRKMHIIAHGMGNNAIVNTLEHLAHNLRLLHQNEIEHAISPLHQEYINKTSKIKGYIDEISEMEKIINKPENIEGIMDKTSKMGEYIDKISKMEKIINKTENIEGIMDKTSKIGEYIGKISKIGEYMDKTSKIGEYIGKISKIGEYMDKTLKIKETKHTISSFHKKYINKTLKIKETEHTISPLHKKYINKTLKIGEIVLLAPDVNIYILNNILARGIHNLKVRNGEQPRITIYTHRRDWTLYISGLIRGNLISREGLITTKMELLTNVNTNNRKIMLIDTSILHNDPKNYSYYKNKYFLDDLKIIINNTQNIRNIRENTKNNHRYYILNKTKKNTTQNI